MVEFQDHFLSLWDEDQGRLISFGQLKSIPLDFVFLKESDL